MARLMFIKFSRYRIFYIFVLFTICSLDTSAQVGIGTINSNPSAQLDIVSANRGILIPRIMLSSTKDTLTINHGNVSSLLIFNTNTTTFGENDVQPGYYYWHNKKWKRLLNDHDLEKQIDRQQTVFLKDGLNTEIDSLRTNSQITYQVNVPVAKGSESGQKRIYGVVREAEENPIIKINQLGELYIDSTYLHQNNLKYISQNYTVEKTDQIILVNANDGDLDITLPNPMGLKGKIYTIKKQDENQNNYVNIFGNIAETNNQNHLYTGVPYTGWKIMSNGVQWQIINKF